MTTKAKRALDELRIEAAANELDERTDGFTEVWLPGMAPWAVPGNAMIRSLVASGDVREVFGHGGATTCYVLVKTS